MAIRPEALPSDAASLTEMVLALDAENEKLRVMVQTFKDMVFGKRSERLAARPAALQEQLPLVAELRDQREESFRACPEFRGPIPVARIAAWQNRRA